MLKNFFGRIEAAIGHAESKHPKFAVALSKRQFFQDFKQDLKKELGLVQHANLARENQGRDVAEDLVREELLESLDAYYNGDYENTLIELSQTAAVIVRMMEFVEKQMVLHNFMPSHSGECLNKHDK